MNLKGIYFEKEPKRFYPKNDLAAQVMTLSIVDRCRCGSKACGTF